MATKRDKPNKQERYSVWLKKKLMEKRVVKMTAKSKNIEQQEYLAREAGFELDEFSKDQTHVVTSPNHYTQFDIEPIVFLMKNKLEYWRGSIIKYACRAGSKFQEGKTMKQSEIDDLNKIIEYASFRKRELSGENIVLGDNKRNETRNDNFSATKKS